MIPPAFEYYAPTSVDEVVSLLGQHAPDVKALAGGQSLIPLMRFRLATPEVLVDLNRVSQLAELKETQNVLSIGAMVRHADIERSPLVCAKYPLIADAAKVISDPLVRNRGTVGGALAHADPAGDWGAVMLALRAELVAIGPRGERTLPIDDFFVSLFQSALLPDELLTEIRVPLPHERSSGAYCKLERKVGDFATVAVAAQITLDQNGTCEAVGLGLTGVGPKNLRATSAEAFLRGKTPDGASIKTAAQLAAQDSSPTADLRGSVAYKRDMVRVLSIRVLTRSVERAQAV